MIDELLASELRGRGGAFFPTGRKWSFVPKPDQNPNPHYLVVNADESEPGSFKDNEIIARVPHRFIEGCLITAHAVESKSVFVYIRGEYLGQYEILVAALEEMRDRAGDSAATSTIVVHRGAGAYICGEETALLDSLEGKRGQPRTKPPFPAVAGALRLADRRQQRRDDRDRPADHRDGRAPSTRSSASRTRAARASSRSPATSRRRGNYEIEPGDHAARADLATSAAASRTAASSRRSSPAARRR